MSNSTADPTRLRRTAYHEAGHAVVADALGQRPGAVTIEGREHWRGLCFTGAPLWFPSTDNDRAASLPAPLWPARLRRSFEVTACVALAGNLAAVLAPREVVEETVRVSEPTVTVPTALGPSERAKLEAADAPGGMTDDEIARGAVEVLAPDDPGAADALLHYLVCVTQGILWKHPHRLERVAEALLEHRTLSGRALRELLSQPARSYPRIAAEPREAGLSSCP